MKNNIFTYINKKIIIDTIFVILLFYIPIILKEFFGFNSSKITTYFILFLSIWAIVKIFICGLHIDKITIIDIIIVIICIYSLLHFYFFSQANIYYYKLWRYGGYVCIFFIFKWILNKTHSSNFLAHFTLTTILITCIIQSILGYLQYFEIIKTKSNYFNLLGTFNSPNFFAVFLSFGFIILIWFLFIKKVNSIYLKTLFILCLILFGGLIIISKSRATWIALIAGFLTLFITSPYGKSILRKTTIKKALLSFFIIIILGFIIGKQLYQLKPESVKGRALVAKVSLEEIVKEPLKGHGLFSFPGKYNAAKAYYFSNIERPWDQIKHATYVFTPFNDYLLVAFELGIPVLLTLIALIMFVIKKTKITDITQLGLAIFIITLIWGLFNAPSEKIIVILPSLFGFALIVNQAQLRNMLKTDKKTQFSIKIIILIISVLFIFVASIKLINTNKYNNFGDVENTQDLNKLIYYKKFTNESFYTDLNFGRKLYSYGYHDEAISFLEKAFKKTSAPRIGKQLATYYIKEDNYKRAEEIYKFNRNIEPYRFEAQIDQLNLADKLNRYGDIINLSKNIINFPVKVSSAEVDNYKKIALNKNRLHTKTLSTIFNLKGSLSHTKFIESKILNKTLSFKLYLPPVNRINKKLPVIYINDGFSYINKGKMPQLLDSLITNHVIEPLAAVFLNPVDKDTEENIRQELFLCNPLFVDFFTNEFIPVLENKYPIGDKKEDRTILGLSFGGLAAAYLVDKAPDYFQNLAMQSPALHPCPEIYKSYKSKPKKDFKMYLSYGTGKDTEKQGLPFIKVLQSKGYNLKVERIKDGNHKWHVWKEQLNNILLYYFEKK